MARFSYQGRDGTGALVSGSQDGASLGDVADMLSRRGITVTDLRPAADAESDPLALFKDLFAPKVPEEEVMLFFRQLHTLLRSGVPIIRALRGLQESSQHPVMVAVITDLSQSLAQGRELSAGMARHPKTFTSFHLSMVRIGEMTGRMDEIFLRLFHHVEFEKGIRDKVKAALRYPMLVLGTMAMAIVVINVFVIPAFAGVYKSFGANLPWMTRALIACSDFVVHGWPLMLGLLLLTAGGLWRWTRGGEGQLAWHRLKLRLPVIGSVIHRATLSRFARSFALGLQSGIPVTQAMNVVSQTVDNEFMSAKILRMRSGVERGESVLQTAIAAGVFTPVVLQMIAVGEESGALDEMLQEVAEMYRRDVEYELSNLSAQIEPILVVFLGIVVLILAMGIFLPIWDIGRAAMGHH